MRELLTEQEIDLLNNYADFAMRVRPTAEAMHYDRRTIFTMLDSIKIRTGYDPKDFWDLYAIMRELEKEGESGRNK